MSDYIYIRAYCLVVHLEPYYVRGELLRAKQENAPKTAIYSDDDGGWATLDDLTPDTRRVVERTAEAMEAGK